MSYKGFQRALGHQFVDMQLLETSLTHRSFSAEVEGVEHNERFEFLGDAVLQLAVTSFLFESYPNLSEGKMAKVRASCVSGETLVELATKLCLGDSIRLGRGETSSGGKAKHSILADTMEAVIAAVYLDAGIAVAEAVVLRHWKSFIVERALDPGRRDYKTRLQEHLAQQALQPDYLITGTGPDHDRRFTAVVTVEGQELGIGVGSSKKDAQQAAAREALAKL